MIQIKPVSDLKNKFTEIEAIVNQGEPVYLTKNGYGSRVVLSLEEYSKLTDCIGNKLDEADSSAMQESTRLTHDEVFSHVRNEMRGK